MARSKSQQAKSRRPFIEELEPRLLMSAGLEAFVLQDNSIEGAALLQPATETQLIPQATTTSSDVAAEDVSHELVFIDTDTPDYQQLLDDLLNSGQDNRQFEVILLDNEQSGIDQISEVLASRHDLDAVHIISHGADGVVELGNTQLEFNTLLKNSSQIANWGKAFSQDGDMLLYGCDLAATTDGQSLVNALAQLTGTDVAASDDKTGNTGLGGDWDLEYQVGVVETYVAFSQNLQQQWNGVLAAPTADAGGAYAINEGDAVLLDASASSDPDGDPLTYSWDINNDAVYGDATGVSPTLTWAQLQSFGINDDGAYTIGVQVDDGTGNTATANATINVANTAPTITTTGSASAEDGQAYTLYLNAADPGNDTVSSWTINWGDGNIDTLAGDPSTATHTYNNVGLTYNITASVTDEDGTFFQNQLLVSSSKTDSLMRYGTDGTFLQEFGTGAGLNYPVASTIGQDGNLYVTNWNGAAAKVARFDPATGNYLGDFVTTADNGGMGRAAGLAFGPDGNLYVASTDTGEVLRFDGTTGAYIDVFVSSGTLNSPEGLVFGQDGNLYVGGYNDNAVYKFDGSTGALIFQFDPTDTAKLKTPEDMTFGPDGNLYVASDDGSKVVRYNPNTGAYIDDFVASGDGGLQFAQGLRFGPDGNLYVGSFGTDSILRYDGTTGAFIDQYVSTGSGGLNETTYFDFIPGQQVTVTAPNTLPVAQDDAYVIDEDTTLTSNDAWYDANWQFRQTISFNNAAQTENLTDFPVLIALDSSRIDYTNTQNDGGDLRFTDSDGTLLAYEIQSWDETGTSYVWVKVPQIDGSSNNDYIWMYYGNAGAANGQDTTGAVWNNGYTAVYHLDEPGTSFADATTNHVNATDSTTTVSATGQIGAARDFNGTTDSINLGSNQDFINNASMASMSAWINTDTIAAGSADIVSVTVDGTATTSGSRLGIARDGSNVLVYARTMDDSSDVVNVTTTTNPLTANTWQHVTVVADYASDTIKIYVDGVEQATTGTPNFTLSAIPGTNSANGAIGSNEGTGGGAEFDGTIDEARISNAGRSADWIKAQYENQRDNFVTFGYQQTVAGVLGNDIDPQGDTLTATLISGTSNGSLTFNADGSFVYTPNANYNGSDSFVYELDDGSGNTSRATVTITVNPVPDVPTVSADSYSVNEDNTLNVAAPGILSNDTSVDPISVLDYTQTTNGTLVVNADGSFDYTPDPNFNGTDTFTYLAAEAGDGTTNYWNLDGTATDSVGTADGTITGTTTVAGEYGDALSFNEVSDYIDMGDVTYNNDFTISFKFKLDDNSGSAYQYLYSHGDVSTPNSITIYTTESGVGGSVVPDMLRTRILDSNDTDTGDRWIDVDIGASGLNIIGDGQWHEYTLTVASGVGSQVYVDGSLQGSNTKGGDAINPAGSLIVGGRNDFDPNRFYGGDLQHLQIMDRALSATDVTNYHNNINRQTVTITVNPINDAPVLDLDADNSSGATGLDYQTTFVEGNPGVSIVDSDATLVDVDSANLTSLTVTLTNEFEPGSKERLSATDPLSTGLAINWSATTNVLTISGSGSVADYLSVLQTVEYHNIANNPNTTPRVIEFVANDGTDSSLIATATVSVVNASFAPKATNDAFTVDEGSTTILDLAVNDTDKDGDLDPASIQIVSGPTNGTITAINPDGTVVYVHDGSETTSDTFTYTINDLVGSTSNIATVTLTINPVNDAPVNTVPGTQTVVEETQAAIAGISIADADAAAGNVTTQLAVSNGILDVTLSGAATISAGANSSNTLTISGTVADVNATLSSLLYTGNTNVAGTNADTLTVVTNDLGNTGIGGALSDTDTVQIDITNVNDAPTGAVTIDNTTPAQGDTLTASNTLADGDGLGPISYQWQRDGVNISGATGTTYTTVQADVGTVISVVASYTDGQGTNEAVSSAGTAAVTNVNDAPTGSVSIDNTSPVEGDTLTASNTLADAHQRRHRYDLHHGPGRCRHRDQRGGQLHRRPGHRRECQQCRHRRGP